MLGSPTGSIPEEHSQHIFKLKPEEFGDAKEILITIPHMIPKKSQVRIPQSNKKDYCRFRFNPIRIQVIPYSQETLEKIECNITFQHIASLEAPVKCLPMATSTQQNEILLESSGGSSGPEVTLREKGSWQVSFCLYDRSNNSSICLQSEPIRIYGSNYQKSLSKMGLIMRGCDLCSKSSTPLAPKISQELPFLPQKRAETTPILNQPMITLPSITQLPFSVSPLKTTKQEPVDSSTFLGKRPCLSVTQIEYSKLQEERTNTINSINKLQQQLQTAQTKLADIDRTLFYYSSTPTSTPTFHHQNKPISEPRRPPRKYALLFGTNYKQLHESQQLKGAENDLTQVHDLLRHSHEITALVGSSARGDKFSDALRSLASNLQKDDTLLIYITAYGTVVSTTTANQYEEGVIPHDAFDITMTGSQGYRVDSSKVITVTAVHQALQPVKESGACVFLIMDASFSGEPSVQLCPTSKYFPNLHTTQEERFFPATNKSFVDSRSIIAFAELVAANQKDFALCIISATFSNNQAIEIVPKSHRTIGDYDTRSYGLFSWSFHRLSSEKHIFEYIYNKKGKQTKLLFCNFILSEHLPQEFFPQIKFSSNSHFNWNTSFPSSYAPLSIVERRPGTNVIRIALPRESIPLSGGCLLVHQGQVHEQVIGLVELTAVTNQDDTYDEYEAFIRHEISPGAIRRGQLVSIVKYGAGFVSLPLEILPQGDQHTMSSLRLLYQNYTPWIREASPSNTTPCLLIQYSDDKWRVTLKGAPQCEFFPFVLFAYSQLDELVACICKFSCFRFLLQYTSLPFFNDVAKVEFSLIEPTNSKQTSKYISVKSTQSLHYMIRSTESTKLYISLLWFRSDGSITMVKDCTILSSSETLVGSLPEISRDGLNPILVIDNVAVNAHALCLFVSTHQFSVGSFTQNMSNSFVPSPAFLLDLPAISADSWTDRGICSFVRSFYQEP